MSAELRKDAVVLESVTTPAWGPNRAGEPVTIGLPLPKGLADSTTRFALVAADATPLAVQTRCLDSWGDGSVRWLLVDFQAAETAGSAMPYRLLPVPPDTSPPPAPTLRVLEHDTGVDIDCGTAQFHCRRGGAFPLSVVRVGGHDVLQPDRSGLVVTSGGSAVRWAVRTVTVRERGPLRAELQVIAAAVEGSPALDVFARIEFFAGLSVARMSLTIRNPRAAQHAGGRWALGDPGSIDLDDVTVHFGLADAVERVRCAAEAGHALTDAALPLRITQAASGGPNWRGPVHRDRRGEVTLTEPGYRFESADEVRRGERATPIVAVNAGPSVVTLTVPHFWQNFPRSVRASQAGIEVSLYPRDAGVIHELQAGEQRTHELVLSVGPDGVSDPPLAWCHDPLLPYPSPEWISASGAIPLLVPAAADASATYLALCALAHDPERGFLAKRERIDEFGWRNFGDLWADHESIGQPPDQPLVSHYNNQYDALAAFIVHFLRTGDRRWWPLFADLASHVVDIDIYHTELDKPAYCGGLFWHTNHHIDAGTSTHRTYPLHGNASGGPSAEHNYNAGLMLHYFLTGNPASREAAIGLGQWVLDMDDPALTVFRAVARVPTGLASWTLDYHGPGRGAAHSVLACLSAFRLSRDRRFLDKAEELIQRSIHPGDVIRERTLLDAERRWSYTIFLQALSTYLGEKAESGEFDAAFEHARASLVRYARWMAEFEGPYLDRVAELEFPTETWIAQDLRKADVFLQAALYTDDGERALLLERGDHFFRYAVEALAATETAHFTRPLVIALGVGYRRAWFARERDRLPPPSIVRPTPPRRPPAPFWTQRQIAFKRAAVAAYVVLAAAFLWRLGWSLF